MTGILAAELLKLRKRWGIRILALIFILVVVLLTYVLTYVIYKNPPPNFRESLPKGTTPADLIRELYPQNFHRIALSSVNGLGSAIAIILGVLATGSEYGWGTLKTIFTQKPSRATVFVGKFLALVIVALVFGLLLMVAAAASSLVLGLLDGQYSHWPDAAVILQATGALWLILLLWTMFGVLLAVLFQQSALAIGVGLVYGFVVEGLVFGLFGRSGGILTDIEKGFPGANATALTEHFGQAVSRFSTPAPLVSVTQAVVVLSAYMLAFLLVSTLLTVRRDLT
jgi:ABC-2 type transport system permease protein